LFSAFKEINYLSKAKLYLLAVLSFGSFGFIEKIECLVGVILEKLESLSVSTQNNEMEIKSLKEQLSLQEQIYENNKKN